jgi:hypothetical protein
MLKTDDPNEKNMRDSTELLSPVVQCPNPA